MPSLHVIVRIVYTMCLMLALLVALLSITVGARFEVVVGRSILALGSSALLGWAAILLLMPNPAQPRSEKELAQDNQPTGGEENNQAAIAST
jgi:hypothetical protein